MAEPSLPRPTPPIDRGVCPAGRYDLASIASSDLIFACQASGWLNAALEAALTKPEYTMRAGYGPWTQLADKTPRLQILATKGPCEPVLAKINQLVDYARTLPRTHGRVKIVSDGICRLICDGMSRSGRGAACRSAGQNEAPVGRGVFSQIPHRRSFAWFSLPLLLRAWLLPGRAFPGSLMAGRAVNGPAAPRRSRVSAVTCWNC
jgi:hypothetical protein